MLIKPPVPMSSSRQCQVQHWNEGHKLECRPAGSSSPASSESDNRNFSDFLSPRSTRSENFSDTLSVDGRVAPGLSPGFSPYANSPNVSFSAPASPHSGSLLKTSSSVSADGRRLKPKKVSCETFSSRFFVRSRCFQIALLCSKPACKENFGS